MVVPNVIENAGSGAKAFFASASGATTNAFVEVVPTIASPKGLMGVGRVKNTDGVDSMDVRESYTDAFGVTSTKTTTVAPGDFLELNLSINITGGTTGFPPYVSYKVEVMDTVAGNHATYEVRFTAQGV